MVSPLPLCSPYPSISGLILAIIRGMSSRKLKEIILICLTETTLVLEVHKYEQAGTETEVANSLRGGQMQRALVGAECAVRGSNMLEVLFMVQRILHILLDKGLWIHTYESCPNELREEVASLVFAAPKCANCTELHKFCRLLQAWFVDRSFDVTREANQKMIHLLSNPPPSLASQVKAMEAIAAAHGISLNIKKILLSECN